ncbi:MAG: succinate dehydrogenase cytochrome b subunit [Chitinophagales bacterium]
MSLVNSTIGKKLWMALTGLFLCVFLIGHLAGNLQLFIPGEAGRLQFNEYAKFMTSNPVIRILSIVTFASVILHVVDAAILSRKNRAARPVKYNYSKASENSLWSSRNMGILGTLILAFIVLHLSNFWYKTHFGGLELDANGNKDLYAAVMFSFDKLWYVVVYVLAMIPIGFHLVHGFQSGFQTLGINHSKYSPLIKKFGLLFAVIIPVAFALIPVNLYLGNPIGQLLFN